MLKTEELVLFNMERIRRVRVDRKYPAIPEYACVEWVHGPSDSYKEDCAHFLTLDWNLVKDLLKNVYKEFKVYNITTQQELDRKRHLDATIGSNLSEYPLYAMTPRYRMRAYLRQKVDFGLRDRAVRNRFAFVTLMQTYYPADINAWKHVEEERFERERRLSRESLWLLEEESDD